MRLLSGELPFIPKSCIQVFDRKVKYTIRVPLVENQSKGSE